MERDQAVQERPSEDVDRCHITHIRLQGDLQRGEAGSQPSAEVEAEANFRLFPHP